MRKQFRNIPLRTGDLCVDDGAGGRVVYFAIKVGEEPAADALLHHHHTQLGPVGNRWKCSSKNR